MAELKNPLERLKARILAQNGTVLESVEGEVYLKDVDEKGQPRRGPVLVLRSIEEGSQLRLAQPRSVTVLGSLSGQVFGAYRVKVGNLLSGRLEGVRHVEIVHNMASKGATNADSWIVFEATSDPGFFDQAQHGLKRLRELEPYLQPQRETLARQVLLRALKDVPYDIKVFISQAGKLKTAFAVVPGRGGKVIQMDLKTLLRYLVDKTERQQAEGGGELVNHFRKVLEETVTESMRLVTSSGIGAALRKQRGAELFAPQVEVVCEYLFPKLIDLWYKISERYVQRVIDQLSAAPMLLKIGGQLAPFFQIEYPLWKFRVIGGKIVPEKVADCNIAGQLGSTPEKLRMTYSYMSGDDWISQTCELELEKSKNCKLILKNGSVYLTEEDNCLFGPHLNRDGNGTG